MTTSATENWQTIKLSTMEFPAEMLVEYVRMYQHKGQTNIGCDPPGFPVANYIQNHLDMYSSAYPRVPFCLPHLLTPCPLQIQI